MIKHLSSISYNTTVANHYTVFLLLKIVGNTRTLFHTTLQKPSTILFSYYPRYTKTLKHYVCVVQYYGSPALHSSLAIQDTRNHLSPISYNTTRVYHWKWIKRKRCNNGEKMGTGRVGGKSRASDRNEGRRLSDLNKKEVAFLAVSIITLISCLGLTIERIVEVDKHSSDYTFTIVLLVNIVFCSYYIVYGVIFERSSELAIYLIGVVIIWVYLVLNYTISVKGPLKLSRLIAACLLCPVTLGLGCFIAKTYHDSGNLVFRIVGAKPDLQRMCKLLFLFIDLLKLDLQIGVSLTVLVLTTGSGHSNLQIIFVVVAGGLTLASFIIGYFGVRQENYLLMIISATFWISLPAYCIYGIVQAAIDLRKFEHPDSHAIVTFLCCALGICTRVLLLICGIRVVFNFGKELKDKVYGARQIQQDEPR